jgi:hypothetical protein
MVLVERAKAVHKAGERAPPGLAHCSKEIKIHMNNILTDAVRRRAIFDSDAASCITKAGTGHDSALRLKHTVHPRADKEWSVR